MHNPCPAAPGALRRRDSAVASRIFGHLAPDTVTHNPLVWIGLGGIDPDDNPRARMWQQRLHGVMIGVALLALPAYLLDSSGAHPSLHTLASVLDGLIFLAFLIETLWMMHVTSYRARYVLENWLNFVILIGAGASAMGAAADWVPLIRVMRVAVGSLVLVRAMSEFRILFTRRGAPMLVGAAALVMLGGGAVMYWLEPTIHNYWDGLWLAFVTGATIGYGDFVPTVAASRVFAVFMAIGGVTLLTLFTANVVAYFLGSVEGAAPASPLASDERLDELARSLTEAKGEIHALRSEIRELKSLMAEREATGPR